MLSRLYLFALLPEGVGHHLARSNDVAPALPGLRLVSARRRHLTLLALDGAELRDADPAELAAEQAHRIQLARWVMATAPPFSFRVLFDRLVEAPRSSLLKASEPLCGVLAAQAMLREAMQGYGLSLPPAATPTPHVTLGYAGTGRAAARDSGGEREIDGISWLVDELVLVRSWRGHHWHEELGRWRLPERNRASAGRAQRVAQ